jgi:RimJ/RimL family protein N-acetyltransferase
MGGGQGPNEGGVTLRAITAADILRLYEWRNAPDTRPMFRDSRPLDFETHRRFVETVLEGESRAYWLIVEASNVPVGTISLYNFSRDGRECEFGRFVIAAGYRGRGYGRRALARLVELAQSVGLERVKCEVLASNKPALRLYASLGFCPKSEIRHGDRCFVLMEAELSPK